MRECEVKLEVDDVEALRGRLLQAGATVSGERALEDNRLFDDAQGTLAASGRLLRLRSHRGRHVVTFKAPDPGATDGRYKVRIEHETTIGDAAPFERLLAGLGYAPRWRYQKYRESWELHGLHVEIDETPIGTYLELEGDPEEIDRAVAALDLAGHPYITASYGELARQKSGRTPPPDLVFEPSR